MKALNNTCVCVVGGGGVHEGEDVCGGGGGGVHEGVNVDVCGGVHEGVDVCGGCMRG